MPSINNNAKQFDMLKQKYEVFRNKVPDMIAIQAVNFFKRNFELQGFVDNGVEKWKTLSNPADRSRQILRKRGTLKNAIKKIKAERNKVVVGVGADVKYAALQNYGGQVPITPKMRRYFWAMYKQTSQEYYKGLALTKKTHLDIPARKFIGDSAGLVKNIDRMIVKEMNLALKP
jgi:phage gpG-like protein